MSGAKDTIIIQTKSPLLSPKNFTPHTTAKNKVTLKKQDDQREEPPQSDNGAHPHLRRQK